MPVGLAVKTSEPALPPIQGGPACLHLLPWHCNGSLDGFSMAGSQFLYLPTHYIEPSSPVWPVPRNMVSRQKGAEECRGGSREGGGGGDVQIVCLY